MFPSGVSITDGNWSPQGCGSVFGREFCAVSRSVRGQTEDKFPQVLIPSTHVLILSFLDRAVLQAVDVRIIGHEIP